MTKQSGKGRTDVVRPVKYLMGLSLGLLLTLMGVASVAQAGGNYGAASKAQADIVDTAMGAGQFNTLVSAIQAAGLVETLKGEGPFTVFAPTDEAFAQIPKAELDALLADRDALTRVLTYHVVPGRAMAADVAGLSSAKTVQGGELRISTDSGVMVNDAHVMQTDIVASNGVIHVIDKVLLPE